MKKYLILFVSMVCVLLLCPLVTQAKTVTKTYYTFSNTYDYHYTFNNDYYESAIQVEAVRESMNIMSEETYSVIKSVTVCVGITEMMTFEYTTYSEAEIECFGQTQNPRTQRYQSINGAETDEFTFNFPEGIENSKVEININLLQGLIGVKVNYVTVVYEEEELNINGVSVTETNRLDILNDGGSVQYDGKGMLVMNWAELTKGPIISKLEELTIYLKGENSITTEQHCIMQGAEGKLTFTTEGNNPGKLTLNTTVTQGATIVGFDDISYEQNLIVVRGSETESMAEIAVPVKPLVKTSNVTQIVEVPNRDDLSNTIVKNVLYTLDKNHDDGYDTQTHSLLIGSTMKDEDIQQIIATYKPGTQAFADHFAGLTFMVPAGYGKVIVRARTGEEGVLHVKVGSHEPYVIEKALDFADFEFPYACQEATYIYVYSYSPVVEVSAADHRAGKKTTVTVGVGSVGVSSGSVQASNGTGNVEGETVLLSDATAAWDLDAGTFTATNPAVNTIADNAFATFPFLKYIDLSKTSITGLHASRTSGPFAGVSKNTFIYLPAGNSSSEANVVIGSVSERVVLDGQMKAEDEESFGLANGFMAQQVVFDRPFAAGEVAAVYLPFGLRATEATAFGNFYAFDAVKDGNVSLQAVKGDVTAHVPYLFKSNGTAALQAAGVVMSMPETASSRVPEADPDGLYGTYEFKAYDAFDEDVFRLAIAQESGVLSFERLKEAETIRPFECYLYAYGQQANSLVVKGDGITGIERVTLQKTLANGKESWCNLSGQRLQTLPSQKGVYIHQGQKVVVR